MPSRSTTLRPVPAIYAIRELAHARALVDDHARTRPGILVVPTNAACQAWYAVHDEIMAGYRDTLTRHCGWLCRLCAGSVIRVSNGQRCACKDGFSARGRRLQADAVLRARSETQAEFDARMGAGRSTRPPAPVAAFARIDTVDDEVPF